MTGWFKRLWGTAPISIKEIDIVEIYHDILQRETSRLLIPESVLPRASVK